MPKGVDRECDNCGYKTKVKVYKHGHGSQEVSYYFCDVCAKTFLSSATVYPNQCPDVRLHKSVGYIANMILSHLLVTHNGDVGELFDQLGTYIAGVTSDLPSDDVQDVWAAFYRLRERVQP